MFMGHTYKKDDAGIKSIGFVAEKGNDNSISIGHSYTKGETDTISFGGFQDETLFDPLSWPLDNY